MSGRDAEVPPPFEIIGVDGAPLRLEDLIDEAALHDMILSSEGIFGVPIAITSVSGLLLAGNRQDRFAQECLEEAVRLNEESAARTQQRPSGDFVRFVPITYDRHLLGRLVIGPFADPETANRVPSETGRGRPLSVAMARVEDIGAHLATVVELMIFSGHKTLVTSQLHLASSQESYRELCEKNERLEEAYERLKHLDRLKSNFLATVSHELRTPLTSIMGYGEMLGEGIAGPLTDEQHEFVSTIRTKSQQLLGLIMSLLDLSKLESGTMPVRAKRVSIGTVIDEAVSTLLPTALKKGVALHADVLPELPPVLGDGDRLRQVFINLAENAVKFTPRGGSVSITARLTVDPMIDEPGIVIVAPVRPAVEVCVADTGIGIAAEERRRVFDPFYQIDQSSTREHGGAGLGLAIAKRLIDAHQGSIRVVGNEPRGTVFVVTLPSARPGMDSMATPLPPWPPSSGSLPPVFG